MPDADHVPSWPELIILMCFGESEEQPFTGIVEVDDRYADGEEDPLPQTVRVHKSGVRYRVETLDGDPLFIKGSDREWRFSPNADMPVMITQEDDEGFEYGSYGFAIERPRPTRWRGDDFTIPTGPARQSTYLGRNAWEVELAPPPHKPAPSSLTVDAATGMPMRWHSERFGDTFRWTEIEHGVAHADDFFEWAGDYAWAAAFFDEDDAPGDIREMIEREQRERAEQLAALRMPELRIELTARPDLHAIEDGSAHLSYRLDGLVIVERRPHSDDPWNHEPYPGESIEWQADGVDWYVRAADGVEPGQLARIREQLAEPRPDRD